MPLLYFNAFIFMQCAHKSMLELNGFISETYSGGFNGRVSRPVACTTVRHHGLHFPSCCVFISVYLVQLCCISCLVLCLCILSPGLLCELLISVTSCISCDPCLVLSCILDVYLCGLSLKVLKLHLNLLPVAYLCSFVT